MYFVFTIELNLLLPCFGLSALHLRIKWNSWPSPPAQHPSSMAGVSNVQFEGGRAAPPLPFSLFAVLIPCVYSRNMFFFTFSPFKNLFIPGEDIAIIKFAIRHTKKRVNLGYVIVIVHFRYRYACAYYSAHVHTRLKIFIRGKYWSIPKKSSTVRKVGGGISLYLTEP